jgi:hypothetical protein
MSLTAKASRADFALDNSGTGKPLADQVANLLGRCEIRYRPETDKFR